MARKRREKTRYTGIYKQTGSNLYDVKYNYKEIDEATGETRYRAKWVGSLLVMLTIQIQIFHSFFSAKRAGGEIQEWK